MYPPPGSVVYVVGYPPGWLPRASCPDGTGASTDDIEPAASTAGDDSWASFKLSVATWVRRVTSTPTTKSQSELGTAGTAETDFPQQIQGGSGSHTPTHTHQPHHVHTIPLPVSTPSSGTSSHHGHQQPPPN
ncbi:hypothetical protein V5O48_006433, partial [Marasmius crinis-equi]